MASEAKVASRKTLSLFLLIFKLVTFQLLYDNQMAAMLFRLAFISLLPQGMCWGYVFTCTCNFCLASIFYQLTSFNFARERRTARVSKFNSMFVELRLLHRRWQNDECLLFEPRAFNNFTLVSKITFR